MNAEWALVATRGQEIVLGSLPQAATQVKGIKSRGGRATWLCMVPCLSSRLAPKASALIATGGKGLSLLPWASLLGSITSIAWVGQTADYALDTSQHYRSMYPQVHGFYPIDEPLRRRVTAAGHLMFLGGYTSAKAVAVAVLGT